MAFGSLVSEPKGELGQLEVVTDVAVKKFCFAMSNDRKKVYNVGTFSLLHFGILAENGNRDLLMRPKPSATFLIQMS